MYTKEQQRFEWIKEISEASILQCLERQSFNFVTFDVKANVTINRKAVRQTLKKSRRNFKFLQRQIWRLT
jgi:hypothetical protein